MSPRDFAELCKAEKESLLATYFDVSSGSAVATLIDEMNLSPSQAGKMRRVVDGILTDAFYTLLLGLDGEAAIGGVQHTYQLQDENGNLLTNGELEGEAWDVFHNRP